MDVEQTAKKTIIEDSIMKVVLARVGRHSGALVFIGFFSRSSFKCPISNFGVGIEKIAILPMNLRLSKTKLVTPSNQTIFQKKHDFTFVPQPILKHPARPPIHNPAPGQPFRSPLNQIKAN